MVVSSWSRHPTADQPTLLSRQSARQQQLPKEVVLLPAQRAFASRNHGSGDWASYNPAPVSSIHQRPRTEIRGQIFEVGTRVDLLSGPDSLEDVDFLRHRNTSFKATRQSRWFSVAGGFAVNPQMTTRRFPPPWSVSRHARRVRTVSAK